MRRLSGGRDLHFPAPSHLIRQQKETFGRVNFKMKRHTNTADLWEF